MPRYPKTSTQWLAKEDGIMAKEKKFMTCEGVFKVFLASRR